MKPEKLLNFEFQKIPRSKINPAPYNPRVMDAGARKKLREALRKFGLVEPLVWNKRTGHLVGGHQRLREMDKLVGYPNKVKDYEVPVAVVDLDEKREKELNILLNNPNLMGDYDWEKLAELFKSGEASPFEAGFEVTDLAVYFDEETVKEIAELYDVAVEGDPMMGDVEALAEEAEKIEQIKARKREYRAEQEADIPENYLLVVFPTSKDKEEALKAWGLPAGTRVVDAVRWADILDEECKERKLEA